MKKTLSMLAILSAGLVSCTKDSISLNPSELVFTDTETTKEVQVTSSKEWSISLPENSTLEFSKTAGEDGDIIQVTMPDSYENFNGVITFVCGDASAEFIVRQE